MEEWRGYRGAGFEMTSELVHGRESKAGMRMCNQESAGIVTIILEIAGIDHTESQKYGT